MSLKVVSERPKQCGTCKFFVHDGSYWQGQPWGQCSFFAFNPKPEWVWLDPPPMTGDDGTTCSTHQFPSRREEEIQAAINKAAAMLLEEKKSSGFKPED